MPRSCTCSIFWLAIIASICCVMALVEFKRAGHNSTKLLPVKIAYILSAVGIALGLLIALLGYIFCYFDECYKPMGIATVVLAFVLTTKRTGIIDRMQPPKYLQEATPKILRAIVVVAAVIALLCCAIGIALIAKTGKVPGNGNLVASLTLTVLATALLLTVMLLILASCCVRAQKLCEGLVGMIMSTVAFFLLIGALITFYQFVYSKPQLVQQQSRRYIQLPSIHDWLAGSVVASIMLMLSGIAGFVGVDHQKLETEREVADK